MRGILGGSYLCKVCACVGGWVGGLLQARREWCGRQERDGERGARALSSGLHQHTPPTRVRTLRFDEPTQPSALHKRLEGKQGWRASAPNLEAWVPGPHPVRPTHTLWKPPPTKKNKTLKGQPHKPATPGDPTAPCTGPWGQAVVVSRDLRHTPRNPFRHQRPRGRA